MGNSPTGLRIDVLKPHVQAILDEARRAGPDAARTALYEAEARFPAEARAAFEARELTQSCEALHVLAAVARELGFDAWEAGDLDAAFGYFGDAYTYSSAASAQGCP